MTTEITARIEASRKELLDLGLRNPLLNFRTRVKKIEVVDEISEEIYRILVSEGRMMTFAPVPENLVDEEDGAISDLFSEEDGDWPDLFAEKDSGNEDGIAKRHVDSKLQTKLGAAKLLIQLKKLHGDARTAIEEQGVNILYLALGFLHWYEAPQSSTERLAPLILIPVDLERASIAEQFKVKYSGEEIGPNLSLIEKLRGVFAVELPDIDESDDFEIAEYCARSERAIAGQSRWKISPNKIVLGFFSFGKFLMYRDLTPDAWPSEQALSDNSVIRALFTDGFRESDPVASEDSNVDELVAPKDVHQVLDADSSQILAMLEVNAGRNMVIQGPPGTGKSQTITNIIAESIGQGKKVLFVSEKMAALEVVKRRLDQVGLGDAVLELHSHKTRKNDFIEELRRTLQARKPILGKTEEDIETLTSLRDRLNDYCIAINTPVLESNVSPVDAIGQLSKLPPGSSNQAFHDFSIMRQWSNAQFRENRLRILELQRKLEALGVPNQSPFWGVGKSVLLPQEERELHSLVQKALDDAISLYKAARVLAEKLGFKTPKTFQGISVICRAASKSVEAPNLEGIRITASEWKTHSVQVAALIKSGKKLKELHARYDKVLMPEAWDQDLLSERQYLAQYGSKWWRSLSGKYRSARARLDALTKKTLPKDSKKCIILVDAVLNERRERKEFDDLEALGEKLFGSQWKGKRTDWRAIATLTSWLATVHEEIAEKKLPKELLEFLEKERPNEKLRDAAQRIFAHAQKLLKLLKDIEGRFLIKSISENDVAAGMGVAKLSRSPLDTTIKILRTWNEKWSELRLFVSYKAFVAELREQGLEPLVEVVNQWDGASKELVNAFEATWYNGLVEAAYRERKALQTFDRVSHETAAEAFRDLDRLLFAHNRAKLALEHWQNVPSLDNGGELGVIQQELNKKRRHLPIRKLVAKAGRALQAIKPVFMMSPLSIANYLEPGALKFDLVVFDEASQVKPVDALGAVLRGLQTVVVGDSKQLPPTSFFDTLMGEDDDEESENITSDLESILSMFLARGAAQRMLRWHYRSRHESLIAVSNHEFYDDRLVVFPSPDHGREGVGLRLQYSPNTAYDRGKTRTNPEEAKLVAERIFWYARNRAEMSLGVATFSAAQRDAIDLQLELMRRRDPSMEDFFREGSEEPFFIKNLENVQGDERDVILISTGYGKTKEGYLAMNFGPLNKEGGERRLNVLMTRARSICEIFSNFTADDLDLKPSSARGVSALKTFLRYASDGQLDIPNPTGLEPDSPFEEAVIAALQRQGYELHPQVGAAGFRIDIGVVDSEKPGRYLLGIECDGATYHSARSARDRDRLRQEVLENLGWRIHRIWSTDWFRDPSREIERAVEAIEKARVYWAGKGIEEPAVPSQPLRERETPELERSDSEDERSSSTQAAPYLATEIHDLVWQGDLHEVPTKVLSEHVITVVDNEAPVHVNLVVSRLTTAAGQKRAGSRIQRAVFDAIKQACWNRKAIQRGDFLYKIDGEIQLRDRSTLPPQERKFEYISPEELSAAAEVVIKDGFSLSVEEAITNVARLLGFGRVSSQMSESIREVLDTLSERSSVSMEGESVRWMK